MKAISLGWGVQSFTLAAMSALGELPRVDVAIHSDTTHERSATYEFAARWTGWLEDHDIAVVTVRPDRTLALEQRTVKSVQIPAYTFSKNIRAKNKGKGQLRRQCTQRWKIAPMRKYLRSKYGKREKFELWLGISTDEIERVKPSDVKYITHRFPLLERGMSREDCKRWLLDHQIEVPVKSSCVFCPFHGARSWRDLKANGNGDWSKAIAVDEAIRKARPPFDLFVHSSRKPLSLVGDNIDAQPELDLSGEECSGVCFV